MVDEITTRPRIVQLDEVRERRGIVAELTAALDAASGEIEPRVHERRRRAYRASLEAASTPALEAQRDMVRYLMRAPETPVRAADGLRRRFLHALRVMAKGE